MNKLLSLSEFILWLNSLTSNELLKEFPRSFHSLNSIDTKNQTVFKLVANDAIMWRLVKEYNKFLLMDLQIDFFEGDNKLFLGGNYHNIQPSTTSNFYEIKGIVVFRDTNRKTNASLCMKVKNISGFDIELSKPLNKIIN